MFRHDVIPPSLVGTTRVADIVRLWRRFRMENFLRIGQSADARGDRVASRAGELREINNGHALERNSLLVSMENNKVRLTWLSPVLDDGSGTPDSYELWRRPLGSSAAFTKIGMTTGLTFLDTTAGTAMWEYEITANDH